MQWGVEGVERGLRKRAGGAPTVRGACAVDSRVPGFVLRVAGVEERGVGVSGVVGTCSGVSRYISRCAGAAVRGSEWGRAGG